MPPTRICFVCLGNICRSPLADAILRHQAEARGIELHVESRGVGDWHLGEPADRRMRATASRHGVEVDGVSELFSGSDYDDFDLILTMDAERQADLVGRAHGTTGHILPFRTFDPRGGAEDDVPDPYYGGPEGFETVYEIVWRTCEALLDELVEDTWRARLP